MTNTFLDSVSNEKLVCLPALSECRNRTDRFLRIVTVAQKTIWLLCLKYETHAESKTEHFAAFNTQLVKCFTSSEGSAANTMNQGTGLSVAPDSIVGQSERTECGHTATQAGGQHHLDKRLVQSMSKCSSGDWLKVCR